MAHTSVVQTNTFIASYDPAFENLAEREIRKAAPEVRSRRELVPGVALVETSRAFADLADNWKQDPPVFVRHICPVHAEIHLTGEAQDLDRLVQGAIQLCRTDVTTNDSFSVQTRVYGDVGFKPYDVNTRLASAVVTHMGATLNVRSPETVISVVCVSESAYVGISSVEENLSDWAGGMRRFARERGQVSRSEFKLLEALEVFQVEIHPRGVALDLGAAPGGWTRVLRRHAMYVTAVDPGELHPAVREDPGVRYLMITAENYLAQGPDQYDLIVNDMRMDGRDSARLMVRYYDYVYADGQIIMTLKLPERHRRQVIDHSVDILEQSYILMGMKHLFHNRSEVTLHLRPRYSEPAEGESDRRSE